MDHAAYTDIVAEQSARFLAVLRRADPDGVVPSTPAWTVADLVWHLAEVQWFWGAIVSDLLEDVDALTEPDRPEGAALVDLLRRSSADLVGALRERDPADTCWSWHEDGRSVGWVARRQAHEALIHRVDAELAAGVPVSAAPAELAADGVDELLRVMLKLPSWGTFTPDGCAVRVLADDTGNRWLVRFGRFTGTSPNTGTTYDDDTVEVVDAVSDEEVGTTVSGDAWDLDRWLWGRGPADPLRLGGDVSVAHRLRAIAEVE